MSNRAAAINAIVGGIISCLSFLTVGTSASANPNTEQSSSFSKVVRLPPANRLFEIPVYPGTLPYNENPNFKRLQMPFATSLMVYRTADGGGLDKEKVIAFYRNYLESKGWKDDIFVRRGDEGYLGLRVELFENLADGTRIQLSGKFSLWMAPRDGIYTILLDQWRLSSADQMTLNDISKAIGSLENIGAKVNYRVQKAYSGGEWDRDFENEYLIDRNHYTFIADKSTGPHAAFDKTIQLIILTYRDAAIAGDEARRLKPASSTDSSGGVLNRQNLSSVFSIVAIRNKTVFLIRDHSGKQEKAAIQIAALLEKTL